MAEVHSHGRARAFFSATDDRDEQGLRIYGVAGRLDTPLPELRLRVGVYGHFAPVALGQVFTGNAARPPAGGGNNGAQAPRENKKAKEVRAVPYYLDNTYLVDNPWITVVGCGGTGGFVAEGLCRLFQGREATIVLVDHDRVEPHNLLRQNFYPAGRGAGSRAKALAERLWRRPTGGPSATPSTPSGRRTMPTGTAATPASPPTGRASSSAASTTPPPAAPWPPACRAAPACGGWTPATTPTGDRSSSATWPTSWPGTNGAFTGETCHLLPAPTVQRPDLLTAVPTAPPDVDCAAALDLTDQDPVINQVMAALALQVVRRMVAGSCPFMALYLDMEQGTVTPSLRHPGGGGAGAWPRGRAGIRYRPATTNVRQAASSKETSCMRIHGNTQGPDGAWRDKHSGTRGHALMTEEAGRKVPALGANEDVMDTDVVLAPVKLFSPYTGWTWYITEWDAETGALLRPRRGVRDRAGVTSTSRNSRR